MVEVKCDKCLGIASLNEVTGLHVCKCGALSLGKNSQGINIKSGASRVEFNKGISGTGSITVSDNGISFKC